MSFNDTDILASLNETTISPEEYQALLEFQGVFLTVQRIAISCCCIGLTGAILTLLTVLSHPRLRKSHSHRLIAYLALADCLFLLVHLSDHCVSYSHRDFPIIPGKSLPGGDPQSSECRGIGFMASWFAFASIYWPVLFPINIISRLKINRTPPEWFSVLMTWGLGLVLYLIALAAGGPKIFGGGLIFYCTIYDDNYNFNFTVITTLIAFFGVIVMYAYIAYHFWGTLVQGSAVDERQKKKYRGVIYKLGVFPVIFLVTWLPFVIQSIWSRCYPEDKLPWDLVYCTVTLANLGGFFNWMAYAGLNGQIREFYAHLWKNGFSNLSSSQSEQEKTRDTTTNHSLASSKFDEAHL